MQLNAGAGIADSNTGSMKKSLILASGSPRRKQLLQGLGLSFEVRPVDADESLNPAETEHPAAYIAERKARLAHELYAGSWILACDTVVETLNNEGPLYLGKAKDREEAASMLKTLSGIEHTVRTGHCLVSPDGKYYSALPATKVRFRSLNARLLDWYLNTEEWTDKAGAYGIQGKGALLIQSLNGDYFNVVGLSLLAVDELYQKAGVDILEFAT